MKAEGKKILMNEHDYGSDLPFKLSGDILTTDKLIFVIKKNIYTDEVIIKKEYTNLKEEDGKIMFILSLTKEESKLLSVGNYIYMILQCRDCKFHNTIEDNGIFRVKEGLNYEC